MSRIRTNLITNRMANGAPTVSNGLVISGVTTVTTLDLNGDLDVDGHLNADNVSVAGVSTFSGNLDAGGGIDVTGNIVATGTIETTGSELKITGAEPRLTFTDTDNNPDFQIWANAQKFSIYDSTNSATRINIDSVGHVCINTTTEGNPNADDFTISFNNQGVSGGDQGRCGMSIRSGNNTSGVTQPGYIYFSDGTSGDNESKGVVAYDHNVDDMYFASNGVEKLRIKSDGNIVHNSTTALQLAKGTTAQRPSGVDGMIRFNTTLSQTEEYRDSGWHALSNKSNVSGGTVTTSGSYTIHTFTSSGTLTVSGQAKTGVDYLLVAGGAGGGDTRAGGGGAGGMTETTGATIQPGSYTITVGGGGAGGTSQGDGADGTASSFGSIASVVGGGGGGGQQRVGRNGGSGGGGSDSLGGGSGTSGQGNNGGNSTGSTGGGGGGGKGGQGNQGSGSLIGGGGGAAGASNYSGSTVNYSGGGGGGSRDDGTPGNGGGGGAGIGGRNNSNVAGNASANQGGGGGGGARLHGSAASTYNGGNGGSGIVIIRYLT